MPSIIKTVQLISLAIIPTTYASISFSAAWSGYYRFNEIVTLFNNKEERWLDCEHGRIYKTGMGNRCGGWQFTTIACQENASDWSKTANWLIHLPSQDIDTNEAIIPTEDALFGLNCKLEDDGWKCKEYDKSPIPIIKLKSKEEVTENESAFDFALVKNIDGSPREFYKPTIEYEVIQSIKDQSTGITIPTIVDYGEELGIKQDKEKKLLSVVTDCRRDIDENLINYETVRKHFKTQAGKSKIYKTGYLALYADNILRYEKEDGLTSKWRGIIASADKINTIDLCTKYGTSGACTENTKIDSISAIKKYIIEKSAKRGREINKEVLEKLSEIETEDGWQEERELALGKIKRPDLYNNDVGVFVSKVQGRNVTYYCPSGNYSTSNPIIELLFMGSDNCIRDVNDSHITIDASIRNNLKHRAIDVTVTCQQIAQSGTVLRTTNNTFYNLWEAGGIWNVNFSVHKADQVQNIRCHASDYINR